MEGESLGTRLAVIHGGSARYRKKKVWGKTDHIDIIWNSDYIDIWNSANCLLLKNTKHSIFKKSPALDIGKHVIYLKTTSNKEQGTILKCISQYQKSHSRWQNLWSQQITKSLVMFESRTWPNTRTHTNIHKFSLHTLSVCSSSKFTGISFTRYIVNSTEKTGKPTGQQKVAVYCVLWTLDTQHPQCLL